MQMLIRLIIVGLALLCGGLAAGFLVPPVAHVERSITIHARPATVFALVNSFRRFDQWSPWAAKDPSAKVERSGAEIGVGAKYSWSGNAQVGSGTQQIVESQPPGEVKSELHFGNTSIPGYATFTIKPEGESADVTWAFDSDMGWNPLLRYFGLLFDKLVGPDYAQGLVNLKALAEKLPQADFAGLPVELLDNVSVSYVYVSGSSSTESADIGKALAAAYGKVGAFMHAAGLKQTGAPIAVTRRYDADAKVYEFDAGIPVDRSDAPLPADGSVKYGATPAAHVLKVTHKGPYTALGRSYEQLAAYEAAYGFGEAGNGWEQFVNDPGSTPESDLMTTISVPVK